MAQAQALRVPLQCVTSYVVAKNVGSQTNEVNRMNAYTTIVGRVGKNAELHTFESGNKKATFTLAVNDDHNKEAETIWFKVEAWNGYTDNVLKLIKKGQEVVCSGQLKLESFYSERDSRYKTVPVIRLNQFHLCGKKQDNS